MLSIEMHYSLRSRLPRTIDQSASNIHYRFIRSSHNTSEGKLVSEICICRNSAHQSGWRFGADSISGSVDLSITVPIYVGGAIGTSVRRASIEQIKAGVDAMTAYDQIRESVISAWAGIQSADAQISAANAAMSAGRVVLDGAIQERDLASAPSRPPLDSRISHLV